MFKRTFEETDERLSVICRWGYNTIEIGIDSDTTYEELNEQIKGCLRALGFQEDTIKDE